MLAETYLRVERAFPIVGVGGIDSADAAWKKIRAGATLIQLYTGMVYKGIGIARDIKRGLVMMLDRGKHGAIQEMVGRDAVETASASR
jgi:dihydroorotate dehydrogenase